MKITLFDEVILARDILKGISSVTPLIQNFNFSQEFDARIFLKREDLQIVRSYKLRGAYNKIRSLDEIQRTNGVVCASAGNHAQGVAYSCQLLNIFAKIFMPVTTPKQKIRQVRLFGKDKIDIVLIGNTYDEAFSFAKQYATENYMQFIHPFDDIKVIAGQGTVGLEILDAQLSPIDYVFVPIGGGGLASGIVTVFSVLSPHTKIIGVEPSGAASMKTSIVNGENTTLAEVDRFVDGAAVKRVGELTFPICRKGLHDIISVPEGKVCVTLLRLYNEEAMVVEPAGALTIAALDFYKDEIKGKSCVCIISGSNNDILRTEEIKERALLYQGLKHYFMVQLPQRPGALREFVTDVVGVEDDITYFQFSRKNSKESGPAIVGIELKETGGFKGMERKLKSRGFRYTYLNENEDLYNQLIG